MSQSSLKAIPSSN